MTDSVAQSTLVLGDADFTYSFDLARYYSTLPVPPALTCTGLDSHTSAHVKYADLKNTLARLTSCSTNPISKSQIKKRKRTHFAIPAPVPTTVLHSIDALGPPSTMPTFSTIIFNHPHLGTESFPSHRRFLSHLFASLLPLSTDQTTLHITFATPSQANRWSALTRANPHWKPVDRRPFVPPPTDSPLLESTGPAKYVTWRKGQSGRGFNGNGSSETISYIRTSPIDSTGVSSDDAVLSDDSHALPWMVNVPASSLARHPCPSCAREFDSEKSLVQHLVDSTKCREVTVEIACSQCGRDDFVDEQALAQHVATTHEVPIVKPSWYDKSQSNGWVDEKETRATTTTSSCCSICKVDFTPTFTAAMHAVEFTIEEDNNARSFACETCGKKFREQRSLQQHELVKCICKATNLDSEKVKSVSLIEGEDWWEAAREGKLDVVRAFVEAGRDVDSKNEDGRTALFLAARFNRFEIVKVLAQAGADVDLVDNGGWFPLLLASYSGHLEVCKYLVEDGKSASINKAENNGWTPLKCATDNNRAATIAYLQSKGAK